MTNHTSKERVRGEPWLLFNLCFLITHCGHTHLQRSCRKGIKNVNIRLEICFIVFVRCAYYRMTLSTCSIYIYIYIYPLSFQVIIYMIMKEVVSSLRGCVLKERGTITEILNALSSGLFQVQDRESIPHPPPFHVVSRAHLPLSQPLKRWVVHMGKSQDLPRSWG